MSTFVLIHGAFHGGWCWYKLVAALEARGHKVVAPDLPGHGRDRTPLAAVTLQSYTDCVNAIIAAQREPVVLVGHSMGGAAITLAAEARPQRIRRLVYVTAFLPKDGEALADIAQQDTESIGLANFVMSDDGSYATFKLEGLRDAFYNDCAAERYAGGALPYATGGGANRYADPYYRPALRHGTAHLRRVPKGQGALTGDATPDVYDDTQ